MHAEDESLEEMAMEYQDPCEDAWNSFCRDETEPDEVQIPDPYHAEKRTFICSDQYNRQVKRNKSAKQKK
jgi:hypothetical protein